MKAETPRPEVGMDYSWLHVNSSNFDYRRTGNGGSGYIAYNISPIVGLVADFGGYASTRKEIADKPLMFLIGFPCAALQIERAAYRFAGIALVIVMFVPRAATLRSSQFTGSVKSP